MNFLIAAYCLLLLRLSCLFFDVNAFSYCLCLIAYCLLCIIVHRALETQTGKPLLSELCATSEIYPLYNTGPFWSPRRETERLPKFP